MPDDFQDYDNLFEDDGASAVSNAEDDGESAVLSELAGPAQNDLPGPKLKNLNEGERMYAEWLKDKSTANMSRVINAFMPTINSEIMRYSGPKNLLRSRAKVLTVRAVRTFNPMSGARLNSWVVTNLKPLARYSVKQRDVKIPEVAARQAAAIERATTSLRDDLGRDPTDEELADELGLSVKRVKDARGMAVASVSSSVYDESGDDEESYSPGVVTPSRVPFAQEAVYHDLSDADRFIFDSATGSHGAQRIPAVEVARRLGISPAAVSQRAKAIGKQIEYVVNNG